MGSPAWGDDPRFVRKADRVANWDALHALMSAWSRQYDKQTIADLAQTAHVPSFPLREPAEQLASAQLAHRGFYRPLPLAGRTIQAPGPPFGLRIGLPVRAGAGRKRCVPGPMPLSGVRVLDFSWVIAGPTTTRYLAAMGAEVIKVEAPGAGDPGRATELHSVLGQAKRGIVLDLKKPEAVRVAQAFAGRCDVLIENFATGVMDRLGLGAKALQAINPELIYVSASGLGRAGPESHAVAYGTLLQCYAGFAGLNRHPEVPPRVGLAWLDPMCGLMLAFVVAGVDLAAPAQAAARSASISRCSRRCCGRWPSRCWRRSLVRHRSRAATGRIAVPRMACIAAPATTTGSASRSVTMQIGVGCGASLRRCRRWPGASWPSGGETAGQSNALSAWARSRPARRRRGCLRAGIPAAALATSRDLVASPHLRARFLGPGGRRAARPALARQLRPELRPRAGPRRRYRNGAARGTRLVAGGDRRPAPPGTRIEAHEPQRKSRRCWRVSCTTPEAPELVADRAVTAAWLKRYNAASADDAEELRAILRERLSEVGEGAVIRERFYCDYGYNIRLGAGAFLNFDCVILDVVAVVIGDGLWSARAANLAAAAARSGGWPRGARPWPPGRIGAMSGWRRRDLAPGVTIREPWSSIGSRHRPAMPAGITVASNAAAPSLRGGRPEPLEPLKK